jgi:hypothetical protein
MRFSLFKIVEVALLLFLVGAAFNLAFAATPTSGYVQYSITVSGQGSSNMPKTIIVNETAQPGSQSGFTALTIALSSNAMNFTCSKDVNSSSLIETFPYLSGLTSQSFSYQVSGFSISASITNTGSSNVIFNGNNYQGTNYKVSLSATNSTGGNSISANGSISSMPSGLVDSAQFLINGTITVNAQLLSTNLSLTAPQSKVNTVGLSLLVVGLLVAVAIAVPAVFKIVKHSKHTNSASVDETEEKQQKGNEQGSEGEEKPSYWVD